MNQSLFAIYIITLIICTQSTNQRYIAVTDRTGLEWTEANAYCNDTYGTELATIRDDEDAIKLLLTRNNSNEPNTDFWIGLSDHQQNGSWIYIDGYNCSSIDCGNSTNYPYWARNQPNDDTQTAPHCAIISYDASSIYSMLRDRPCTEYGKNFICNANPTDEPTTFPTSAPSIQPTNNPTDAPTTIPTSAPSVQPTNAPTNKPMVLLYAVPPLTTTATHAIGSTHNNIINVAEQDIVHDHIHMDWAYIIYVVVGIFALITLISWIYSTFIFVNDFYRLGGLIVATIHIVDTLSDAFFAVNITLHHDYPSEELYTMLYISIGFIVIPAMITLYQLHVAIKEWKRTDILNQWISDNVNMLYIISIVTGSSFAGVELCNSNLFNMRKFEMPLSKTQLLEFKTKRIYSTVILENIPQFGVQFWFLSLSRNSPNGIVYASMCLSILSIITSIMAMIEQRNIIRSKHYVSISYDVQGQVIVNNMRKCRNRSKMLRHQISSLLGINKNLIEIVRPKQVKKGLKIQINIYINNTAAIDMNIEKDLKAAQQNGELAEIMKISWKLLCVPLITNIKYAKHQSKEMKKNTILVQIKQIISGRSLGIGTSCSDEVRSRSVSKQNSNKKQDELRKLAQSAQSLNVYQNHDDKNENKKEEDIGNDTDMEQDIAINIKVSDLTEYQLTRSRSQSKNDLINICGDEAVEEPLVVSHTLIIDAFDEKDEYMDIGNVKNHIDIKNFELPSPPTVQPIVTNKLGEKSTFSEDSVDIDTNSKEIVCVPGTGDGAISTLYEHDETNSDDEVVINMNTVNISRMNLDINGNMFAYSTSTAL